MRTRETIARKEKQATKQRAEGAAEESAASRTSQTRVPASNFRMIPRRLFCRERSRLYFRKSDNARTNAGFISAGACFDPRGQLLVRSRSARGCGHGLRPRGRRNRYISASMECRRFVCVDAYGTFRINPSVMRNILISYLVP